METKKYYTIEEIKTLMDKGGFSNGEEFIQFFNDMLFKPSNNPDLRGLTNDELNVMYEYTQLINNLKSGGFIEYDNEISMIEDVINRVNVIVSIMPIFTITYESYVNNLNNKHFNYIEEFDLLFNKKYSKRRTVDVGQAKLVTRDELSKILESQIILFNFVPVKDYSDRFLVRYLEIGGESFLESFHDEDKKFNK